MPDRRGTRSLGRARTRPTLVWVAVLVVALVALDIALVVLAFGRTAPANGPAGPIPTYSSSPITRGSSTGSPSPTPTSQADPEGGSTPSSRYIAAVNGKEAWRASSGTCGVGTPVLEHTVDGGVNWKSVPLSDDVRSLLNIKATEGHLSVLVGTGPTCAPSVRTSSDGGQSWSPGSVGAAGAGVQAEQVVLSSGTTGAPCTPARGAYQGQRTAVVICDSTIEWRSGSAAWVNVPLAGVRAVIDAGDRYTIARVGAATCDGVQIASMPAVSVTPATTATVIGCAADAKATGAVAADRAGASLWLWSGDDVMVSLDGGATW
jgi:hypothetical protein